MAVVVTTKNNFNILAEIQASQYDSLASLYDQLLNLKKDQYDHNDRIVIRSNEQAKPLILEMLEFIDIPDFFVIFELDLSPTNFDYQLHESHCIYPWANLMINNLGDIHPCCYFQGEIFVEPGQSADIGQHSLDKIYLSDHMRHVRDQFRQGQRPESCAKCWATESLGMQSMRQAAKHKFKDIYYKIDYNKEDISSLQIFDLKLGNNCNLSCKICNSRASSTIANQEYAQGRLNLVELDRIKQSARWAESDSFWQQMDTVADNIRYLDLYGGEPLMIKAHFKFLQSLIDKQSAPRIQLDYNTNGTVYSDKFFDLWRHFKQVKLSFSLDDIGQRFEEQRTGASWSQVVSNIQKYQQHRSEKFTTELFPTVNTQNVNWLPELLDWADTQQFDHVNFNILDFPGVYSIRSLAQADKLAIAKKLRQTNRNVLDPIINLLEGIAK